MRLEYLIVSIILLLIVLIVVIGMLTGASAGIHTIFDMFGKR